LFIFQEAYEFRPVIEKATEIILTIAPIYDITLSKEAHSNSTPGGTYNEKNTISHPRFRDAVGFPCILPNGPEG
jgi:hypothetical protein